MGLEIRDVLAKSDLHERKGKNQHAFCIGIGRDYPYDVRVLANVQPNSYWMDTLREDLNNVWCDLVERLQLVKRPPGRDKPDWAAKILVAVAPVYYHNYILGHLTASQLRHYLETYITQGSFFMSGRTLPARSRLRSQRPRRLAAHRGTGHRGGAQPRLLRKVPRLERSTLDAQSPESQPASFLERGSRRP